MGYTDALTFWQYMLKSANTSEEEFPMDKTAYQDIEKALDIVGPEDFSEDGVYGVVTFEGQFAKAIAEVIFPDKEARDRFGLLGQPVRVSRSGGLEIWCNGFYIEGKPVRRIIHEAARRILHERGFRIKNIKQALTFQSARWLECA
jgi:hypothetical protein